MKLPTRHKALTRTNDDDLWTRLHRPTREFWRYWNCIGWSPSSNFATELKLLIRHAFTKTAADFL